MATPPDAPESGTDPRYKWVVGTALAILLGVVLVWLQGAFDQGDRRRAVETVERHQLRPGAPTLGSFMAEAGGGPVTYEAVILSGCRGIMRVTADLDDGRRAVFEVDLVTRTFKAEGPVAEDLIEGYREQVGGGPSPQDW
jgi:hypothetical protein